MKAVRGGSKNNRAQCSPVLCTDSSAALGFVKRKGASRRTRHVDTNIHFMQALGRWNPGQRILKVHGNSQQIADCLTKKLQLLEQLNAKLLVFDRCSNLSNLDEGVRKIAAHQMTAI